MKARRMEDARLREWLPSRPAMDPETDVDMGPREEKKRSAKALLERKEVLLELPRILSKIRNKKKNV